MEHSDHSDERQADGVKLLNSGKPADAEACFREAVTACPEWAEARTHLGVALAALGRHTDALECFERAVALKPDDANAHHHLANTLKRLGRPKDAIPHYQAAIRLKPSWGEAHHNLGLALRAVGDLDAALEAFRRALAENPAQVDARNNLGVTLSDKGLLAEAEASYRQALRLRPDSPDFHNNLAVVLAQQKKRAEAIEHYRRALVLQPEYAEAHNNLGNSLRAEGKLAEAEAALREAIRLKPEYAEAYNNLAIILVKQERVDEALANYRQALCLKPDYPDAHKNYGLALLIKGDFAAGWKEYESRWGTKEMPLRTFAQPRWDGAPLDGKTILLYAEQGQGDSIQFIRYAQVVKRGGVGGAFQPDGAGDAQPLLQSSRNSGEFRYEGCADASRVAEFARIPRPAAGTGLQQADASPERRPGKADLHSGVTVVVECQKALVDLFARCPAVDRVVAQGEPLPPFDTHVALLSIPGIVGTDLANIPAEVPYVSADDERLQRWGAELNGLCEKLPKSQKTSEVLGYTGLKVGIVWQGNRGFQDDSTRSAPLPLLEPLARVPGVRLVSLQKGYGSEQLRGAGDWNVIDLGNRLDSFLDTAAVMQHLDLVISVDTAVAHLAGALGVPVWMALPTANDWRWLERRDDSPWYPTARLFRQKTRGDWAEVFQRMARELDAHPRVETAERCAERGRARLKDGKAAEAAALLQRAIELDPHNAGLHNDHAVALDRLGQRAAALAGFEQAVALQPDLADALFNLGNVLRRMGRMAEAEARYRQCVPLMKDSADLCNHMGIALLGQAKHAEAESGRRYRLQ